MWLPLLRSPIRPIRSGNIQNSVSQQSFFSPRERLELSEIGPASVLRPCVVLCSDPPSKSLGPGILSAIPEVCCPAWPWEPNNYIHSTPNFLDNHELIDRPATLSTCIRCVLLMVIIFIRLSPLSLIPPAVLHAAPGASCWGLSHPKPDVEERRLLNPEIKITPWTTESSLLPCSGFRLSCIVHLFLLPNVLFFLNIVKLLYPLFTAGFKGSCIGLGTQAQTIKSASL